MTDSNDGKAVHPVPVIKPEPDHIDKIDQVDLSEEYSPLAEGGEEPLDIDAALQETGQAPDAPKDDLITEPIDEPIQHLNDNAKDN